MVNGIYDRFSKRGMSQTIQFEARVAEDPASQVAAAGLGVVVCREPDAANFEDGPDRELRRP